MRRPRRARVSDASTENASDCSASPASSAVAHVEGHVARRLAAPQRVIVHAGQVVMDQRIGVDQLDRRGARIDTRKAGAGQLRRGVREQRPHALAAAQRRVTHRRPKPPRAIRRSQAARVPARPRSAVRCVARRDPRRANVGARGQASSASSALERLQHALFEDLHLLLRVLQRRLAEREQFGSALVGGQRFLQRQLAALHPADDRLELGKRGFETGREFSCLGHGGADSRRVEPQAGEPPSTRARSLDRGRVAQYTSMF